MVLANKERTPLSSSRIYLPLGVANKAWKGLLKHSTKEQGSLAVGLESGAGIEAKSHFIPS